ncbi:MAG: hypothetical protein IJE82_00985, partial [Alphaproteobacteria bacterium]|nr:hypothetical protein [Alphaproteobacteria bacterium]
NAHFGHFIFMLRWLDKNPRTSDAVAGVRAAGERGPMESKRTWELQSLTIRHKNQMPILGILFLCCVGWIRTPEQATQSLGFEPQAKGAHGE